MTGLLPAWFVLAGVALCTARAGAAVAFRRPVPSGVLSAAMLLVVGTPR